MLLLPLESQLFPYTTLFRSGRPSLGRRFIAFDVITHRQLSLFDLQTGVLTRPVNLSNAGAQTVDGANVRGDLLDRKSTRLNSSHVEISYAVFCLKKKKNKHM